MWAEPADYVGTLFREDLLKCRRKGLRSRVGDPASKYKSVCSMSAISATENLENYIICSKRTLNFHLLFITNEKTAGFSMQKKNCSRRVLISNRWPSNASARHLPDMAGRLTSDETRPSELVRKWQTKTLAETAIFSSIADTSDQRLKNFLVEC